MIQAECVCGHVLKAEDQYAGRKAKCPKCGAGVLLPRPVDETYRLASPPITVAAPIAEALPQIRTAPPPAPAIEDREDEEESESSTLDRSQFRRHFFAVWCGQWALRIMGWALIAWCGFVVFLAGFFWLVALLGSAKEKGPKLGPMASLGIFEVFFIILPTMLGTLTVACLLLAGSQLLTALSWSYIRQGLGGAGPIES